VPHYLNDRMIRLQAIFETINSQFEEQQKQGMTYIPTLPGMGDHEAAYRLLNGRGIACQ